MTDPEQSSPGRIVWHDLTVPNAGEVRDFYAGVAGWEFMEHDMGEYSDFSMNQPSGGETVAGICHARGPNANLPAQWLIYIRVADVDASAEKCRELGGTVLDGPREAGEERFCVIRDPAGAVAALIGR